VANAVHFRFWCAVEITFLMRFNILLSLVVVFAFYPANICFAVGARYVLKASFENVRSIRSIEFTASFENTVRLDIPSKGISSVRVNKGTLRYYQSGDFFRVEVELHNEDGSQINTYISTFDGKKNQQFSKEQEILEFKKTPIHSNPNLFSNPVVSAYMWLLGYDHAIGGSETPAIVSEIKNLKLWKRCFVDAKIVGGVVKQGIPITVVDFSNRKIDSTMRVWFANDSQFFPIHWRVSSKETEEISNDCKIEKFLRLKSDGQSFYIPTIVRMVSNSPTCRIHSVVTIDESTLFVNRTIEQDHFTIPETLAKIVTDIDEIENPFGGNPTSTPVLFRFSLTIIGLIMIIVALFRLFYAKTR